MLGTRERALLLENLRPPSGYRLRRAVGTSFTLDLIALLTAPLAFTFFDAHDDDGAPVTDPLALLEALRRHADRITLFCQAGAIAVPAPQQTLLTYLEDSVVEVGALAAGGIFHPKVWVLAFESDQGPALYRVLCLSRNLTFARAWDACLALEGPLAPEHGERECNRPLGELLRALCGLASRSVSAKLRKDLERMAGEIVRVDFRPPEPFHDFRIHNLGLGRGTAWPFPKSGRSLVVSPYLAGSVVGKLAHDHGLEALISRPEAFEDAARQSGSEILPRACYVLSPGADFDSRETEPAQERQEPSASTDDQIELTGLHAKLFLFECGPEARLFVGSANATRAAFENNIEVLVELVGRTRDSGIASFLGPEDDARLETIRSLLQEYHPPERPIEKDPEGALDKKAERLAYALATVRLTATVRETESGAQRWDVSLSGALPRMPDGTTLKVWPATLAAESALAVSEPPANLRQSTEPPDPIATFRGLSFEALTAFFAFEISIREGGHEAHRRFAVTAALLGAPEDRKERLLHSLLKDRRRVLQLLFLILMDEGADVSAFVRSVGGDRSALDGSFQGWDNAALLEALLRSLSRDPHRIDDAARLIADLQKTPDGADRLPEGFKQIWEPVLAARKALER